MLKKPVEPNISQVGEAIVHLSSIKKKMPHKTPINTTWDMSPPLNTLWGELAWVHDPFNYFLFKIKGSAHKCYTVSPPYLQVSHP